VSVWLLKLHGASHRLDRLGGYDATRGTVLLQGQALDGDAVTAYLDALQDGTYASGDEPGDPRSLLDAVIGVNGRILGVLCCERRGDRRPWTPSETRIARIVANEIALAVARGRKAVQAQRFIRSISSPTPFARPEPG
jgi:GAF domain-containing protein